MRKTVTSITLQTHWAITSPYLSSPVVTDFGGSVEQRNGGEENREAVCSERWRHEYGKEHHHHADSHRDYAVRPEVGLGQRTTIARLLAHLLPPFQFLLVLASFYVKLDEKQSKYLWR